MNKENQVKINKEKITPKKIYDLNWTSKEYCICHSCNVSCKQTISHEVS